MDNNLRMILQNFRESFVQLVAALQDHDDEVGKRYDGVVTNLIDINNFYVVPLNLYQLLHIMEKPGSIMSNYSQFTTVIYFSPQLDRHVRGKVNLVNPDRSCNIFAIDYGVTDARVTPEKIFNLFHHEVVKVPGLAVLCELGMCYPREGIEFTREAQESFKFFMGQQGEPLLLTVLEKTNWKLTVLVQSSNSDPYDVTDSLVFCDHTRYDSAQGRLASRG